MVLTRISCHRAGIASTCTAEGYSFAFLQVLDRVDVVDEHLGGILRYTLPDCIGMQLDREVSFTNPRAVLTDSVDHFRVDSTSYAFIAFEAHESHIQRVRMIVLSE